MRESEVSKSVSNYLDLWQIKKVVIHHDRINAGKIRIGNRWINMGKKGSSDRVAYILHEGICWIYFIECKRSVGGKLSEDQKNFAMKFDNCANVVYEVVNNPNQVNITIERITKFDENTLNSISID